jgi:hypothetical protein
MRLEKRQDAQGSHYVRPAFRADDYRVTPNAMRGIMNWKSDHMPTEALLEMHDGPFAGWRQISRFERGGKQWVRYFNASGEYGVDVEIVDAGLGQVVELDPKLAYDLAVENDRARTDARVVQE